MRMIPRICPKCKRLNYWNRELDLSKEGQGIIRERWECDTIGCNYKTRWFTFVRQEVEKFCGRCDKKKVNGVCGNVYCDCCPTCDEE